MIVSGKISVKAILENKKREIQTVYILDSKQDMESRYILSLTKDFNVKRVSREELDILTQDKNHGGYAIECEGRESDIFQDNLETYFFLEGISDPYNMGDILRTLYTLGVDSVITPVYNFYEHEAKLIKASAGASEHINWVLSENVETTLNHLKDKGVKIVAAHRQETSASLTNYQFKKPVCICMGGAYRGLSSKVLALSDESVRLEYKNRVALSTSSACSVFAYALFLQKEESQ